MFNKNDRWNPHKKHSFRHCSLFRHSRESGNPFSATGNNHGRDARATDKNTSSIKHHKSFDLRALIITAMAVCVIAGAGYAAVQLGNRAANYDWAGVRYVANGGTQSQTITPEMRKAYKLACEALKIEKSKIYSINSRFVLIEHHGNFYNIQSYLKDGRQWCAVVINDQITHI